ncbi:hypothetical protein Dimus_019024 [Dionaea muscipula]
MAISWILLLKLALVSSAVLSTAVILEISTPIVQDFLTADLPLLWSSFLSWLRPPYLYLVLNCIILTIAASSKLQPSKPVFRQLPPEIAVTTLRPVPFKDDADNAQLLSSPIVSKNEDLSMSPILFGYIDSVVQKKAAKLMPEVTEAKNASRTGLGEEDGGGGVGDEFVIYRSAWTPMKRVGADESPVSSEKPLVSSRFGNRKAARASPEGRALGVSKPRRNETLEATWRTITEGRQMPLTRHLKRSDTSWDTAAEGRRDQAVEGPRGFSSPVHVMKKLQTFSDQRSSGGGDSNNSSVLLSPSPGSGGGGCSGGKLRREWTLSHDELNRRVEAFIRKFNEEMRLQRQQSFDQYREMVSPGAL